MASLGVAAQPLGLGQMAGRERDHGGEIGVAGGIADRGIGAERVADHHDPRCALGLEPCGGGIDFRHRLLIGGAVFALERPGHFRRRHQRPLLRKRGKNAAVGRAGPGALAVQVDDADAVQVRGLRRGGEGEPRDDRQRGERPRQERHKKIAPVHAGIIVGGAGRIES